MKKISWTYWFKKQNLIETWFKLDFLAIFIDLRTDNINDKIALAPGLKIKKKNVKHISDSTT